VIIAVQQTRLASLPALPAARRLENCNRTPAEIVGMLFSLVIKNAKIATRLFNDFREKA
jgi:hypothetical protein